MMVEYMSIQCSVISATSVSYLSLQVSKTQGTLQMRRWKESKSQVLRRKAGTIHSLLDMTRHWVHKFTAAVVAAQDIHKIKPVINSMQRNEGITSPHPGEEILPVESHRVAFSGTLPMLSCHLLVHDLHPYGYEQH